MTIETPAFSKRMVGQILFSLMLVALADWFFYGHTVGWTLGAFGLLFGGGVLLLGDVRAWTRAAAWLGTCYVVLCLRMMIDPEPRVVLLGSLSGVGLMFTARSGWTWRGTVWLRRLRQIALDTAKSWLVAAGFTVAAPLLPIVYLSRTRRIQRWLLPVALGCLFLGLFAHANPVISLALSAVKKAILDMLKWLPSLDFIGHLVFWITIGAVVWTMLRHRARDPETEAPAPPQECLCWCDRLLQPDVIRNALVIFNVLFAVQTTLDFWYLLGGGTLPQGVTYAEYAQRGAYPLVATALLAAGFVLVTFRDGSVSAETRTARWLVYGWLAQNVLLVVSAGWRLWMYVSVYSLSRLRLAAGLWMVLVACGLILIIVRIWGRRSNGWLVRCNLLSLAAALMIHSCGMPNMLIADFNVRHCREMGCADACPVDIKYLTSLGYDALPALIRLEYRVEGNRLLSDNVHSAIVKAKRSLDTASRDWRGATLKRRYVTGKLAEYEDAQSSAP